MAEPCLNAPLTNRLLCQVAKFLYRILGWRAEAVLPDLPKYELILAPHTSNWDAIYAFIAEAIITCGFHTVKISFLAKHTLFRGPLGILMRWLNGIPVDRRAPHGVVEQVLRAFDLRTRLVIGITPEGQRRKTRYWKTGFYHVAYSARIPILLVYVDYRRKVVGSGPLIMPTGDIQADMAIIREFYSHVTARHPERVGAMEVPPDK